MQPSRQINNYPDGSHGCYVLQKTGVAAAIAVHCDRHLQSVEVVFSILRKSEALSLSGMSKSRIGSILDKNAEKMNSGAAAYLSPPALGWAPCTARDRKLHFLPGPPTVAYSP